MIKNSEFTLCDIIANSLNSDIKRRAEFLTVRKEEQNIAVREAAVWSLSQYGRGEGNVPIAVTRKGMIIAGFVDPAVRDGVTSTAIVTTKKVFDGVIHNSMLTRQFITDISRPITYDMLRKYVKGLECELKSDVELCVKGIFNSSMNNINRSFARERYNLILSIKELEEIPEQLDRDSFAGMNLLSVSEMVLRMVISEEDVKGNKKYLKRSEVDANPLIREGIIDLVYKLVKEEVETERAEAAAEAKAKAEAAEAAKKAAEAEAKKKGKK